MAYRNIFYVWFFTFNCFWIFLPGNPCFVIAQSLEIQKSHVSGAYEEPFLLSLTVTNPQAVIRFTLDGRVPTLSDQEYANPLLIDSREGAPNVFSMIPTNNIGSGHPYRENWVAPSTEVFKINIIRAKAFLPDGTSGPVLSATYLIDDRGIMRYAMPIVSIIAEGEDIFGFEKGIYVPGITGGNYFQRGRDWEREVFVSLIETDGKIGFEQDAGVRIHGGTSRNRPRKTLRLYARGEYGNSWFEYPIFQDKEVSRYKRFLLRNSGNDWSESLFRDAYLQALAKENTALDIQYSRPCIVFINGEYWGIHNMRDRMDERYLEAHYGLDPEQVTVLEGTGTLDTGNPDGQESYQDLLQLVTQQDMTNPQLFAQAEMMMDMDNYIDYQILQIFARNTDWPGNNIAFWKHLDGIPQPGIFHPGDGRWRWMVFDMDFGFGLNFDYVQNAVSAYGGNTAFHNTLAMALEPNGPSWPNPPWSTNLFRNLMENDGFKQKFVNRYADHLNTTFSERRCLDLLDSLIGIYAMEIQEHILRWTEPSFSYWQQDLERMRTFANLRERFARSHVNSFFNLGGSHEVTVDINESQAGWVQVNSIHLNTNTAGVYDPVYPWNGLYFNNSTLQLVAHSQPGFEFKFWEGDVIGNSDTLYVPLNTPTTARAVFEYTGVHPSDPLNPVAFPMVDSIYTFTSWRATELEGNFPPHMIFQQSRTSDPGLQTPMTDPYFIPFISTDDNEYHSDDQDKIGLVYSLTGRTRIEGLGEDGIAMINTGRNRDLGAVVLALDTRGVYDLRVDFTAATLDPGSRVYELALQYREGISTQWEDVLNANGKPVRYVRDSLLGVPTDFQQISLPATLEDKPYVQLRWKYFYTGERLTQEHGRRDKIRLDDIIVRGDKASGVFHKPEFSKQDYYKISPNPTSSFFEIEGKVPFNGFVEAELFDLNGKIIGRWPNIDLRIVNSTYSCVLPEGVRPGIYLLRLISNDFSSSKVLIVN